MFSGLDSHDCGGRFGHCNHFLHLYVIFIRFQLLFRALCGQINPNQLLAILRISCRFLGISKPPGDDLRSQRTQNISYCLLEFIFAHWNHWNARQQVENQLQLSI
jgi:hypothetical protein